MLNLCHHRKCNGSKAELWYRFLNHSYTSNPTEMWKWFDFYLWIHLPHSHIISLCLGRSLNKVLLFLGSSCCLHCTVSSFQRSVVFPSKLKLCWAGNVFNMPTGIRLPFQRKAIRFSHKHRDDFPKNDWCRSCILHPDSLYPDLRPAVKGLFLQSQRHQNLTMEYTVWEV